MKTLALGALSEGMPGLTPGQGTVMAEAATMCLDGEGHPSPVTLSVEGDFNEHFQIDCLTVTDQMRRGYGFDLRTTDLGACGIALNLLTALTDYEVVEEAARGTNFDYWIAPKGAFLFQGSAKLEISGLRHAADADVDRRTREKVAQMNRSSHTLPGYVIVVEFSRPVARVVQR